MTRGLSVDIIVNNFNYASFLEAAIDSALAQDHAAVRVIVVDDGSTDDSRAIIASYGDRITPVLKNNGGQAAALNAGFEHSKGDVVMFLDADDVLLPSAARLVVDAFTADPRRVKVQYRMEVIDAAGRPSGAVKPPQHLPMPSGDFRAHELAFPFDLTWLPTSGNAFAGWALQRLLPIPEDEFAPAADWYLQHLTPLLGPVASLTEIGAQFRTHGANDYEPPTPTLDLEHVRKSVVYAAATRHQLEEVAGRFGLGVPRGGIVSVSDIANRMISLRLDHRRHPLAYDTVSRLLVAGARAAARRFDVSPVMRLMFVAWFAGVAVLPRRAVRGLAVRFLFAERRPRLNRVLGALHRAPTNTAPQPPRPAETRARPPNGTREGAIRRYLFLSTLSNYAGQIVTTGVWFALTPFILHRLGPTQYGLWALVASFVAYGQLLDFGIAAAVTKYVAELRARDDPDEASRVVATALRLYAVIGIGAAALSIPFGLVAPTIFNLPGDTQTTLSWLIILSGIGVGIQLPATTAYAVLRGLQRYDLINLISALAMLALGLSTVAVLLMGGGVVGMAAVAIPLTVFWQVPTIFLVRRNAPELRFGWRGARRELVRTVASFSWAVFVSNTAGRVKTKTDEVVIAAAMPVAQVTPYAVARRVSDLPELTSYQFVRVLMPLASRLHGEEDHDRLRLLYVASTRLALAIFVAVGGGLVVLAGPLLAAWVGDEYAGSAHIVLILTAAGMLDIVLWPAASVLQGMGRHRPTAVIAAAGGGLNLGLSILLIHRMGITGVALGTLIATSAEVLVFLPYAMRLNRVSLRTALADVLTPALVPGILMLVALLSLRELLEPSSLLAVAGLGSVGVLLYVVGFLSFSVNQRERQTIVRALCAAAARARAALGRQTLTRPRKL